ncbi:hypothetical protein AGDE_13811 [Angomonas deanei]|uniref:Uncharacterized protein n=1 Tax=Angomonas deanei TaxID=59799 RepID=A0A7G2CKZ6_9TRYP|nr:hypothetical protein AGDE_13811 [Angomonas deanei]CAD2220496.1 hypothetical protein, conserved [Angomonas deanei]|eukprot:EPY21731.1 hypothetical protein AGDE_13811 [Angomonas deanei]
MKKKPETQTYLEERVKYNNHVFTDFHSYWSRRFLFFADVSSGMHFVLSIRFFTIGIPFLAFFFSQSFLPSLFFFYDRKRNRRNTSMSRYATDRAQASLYSGGNTNSPHRFRNSPNRVPTTRESPHFHPSARHNTDDPFDVPLGGGEAPVSPGVVAAGDTLRDIYREKLQQSVDSVVQALTTEVPEDHLLLQLLADPHTESYVKVRLTEIVESFLYASQSDAYHLLALQLAEREKELVDLNYVLENCSRNMDELTATKVGVPKSCQTDLVEYKDGLVADPPIATVVPHHTSANPMEEEAARQELLAILEETAREREIERSREALHPTRQVIDMVRQLEQPTTVPISTAEVSKPVLSLFKALNELVHYVDESLESLDALRNDLDLPGNTSGLSTISAIQSVGNTPMKNHNTSNPQNSRVSHSSNRAVVQQERRACRELLSQLQESHIAMVRYLDRLALTQQQQTAELEEKSRDMEERPWRRPPCTRRR